MSNLIGIFVQGHMPIMLNVCRLVLLVTILFAVSSYQMYILTQLSHTCT